ncbi:hypothetical protein [Microcystis phage Mwe-JY13]
MMEPVAWMVKTRMGNIAWTTWQPDGEPLVRLSDAEARIRELEAANAFTLSDGSRMLQKSDVQGVCPHPDDCFYFGDRVRCGPCAVKASAAKGIAIDDTHSHLPEVCRLRRELKAAEALLKEAGKTTARLMSRDPEETNDIFVYAFRRGVRAAARAIHDKIGVRDD